MGPGMGCKKEKRQGLSAAFFVEFRNGVAYPAVSLVSSWFSFFSSAAGLAGAIFAPERSYKAAGRIKDSSAERQTSEMPYKGQFRA
jgi:hypothetical protein